MRKTTKKNRTSTGYVIARAVVGGVLAAVIMLLAYSFALDKEWLPISGVSTAVTVINFLSASVCGLLTVGSKREGRGVRTIAACGIYTLTILVFSLATDENGTDMAQMLRIVGCGIGGIICGFLLPLCKSNKKLRKRGKNKK